MRQTTKTEESTEIYTWGADRYGQLGLGNTQTGKCYCTPRFSSFSIVIKSVACGEEHSALITLIGQIFTIGSNNEGRLGLGNKSIIQSSTPSLVEALSNFNAVSISCGWGHTAAIMDNGDLYTWGVGEYGALGIIDTESQWFPVKVVFPDTQVKALSADCGTRHTAIVDVKGVLYMCGTGDAGQLGTGRRDKELLPRAIPMNEKIEYAACGVFHTLILSRSGKVYATGGNSYGQLGIGGKRSVLSPMKVESLEKYNITKVSAGHHSAAITDKGDLFIWGTGAFGEYDTPTLFSTLKATDISIGSTFGVLLDTNGNLYSWGTNSNGELGIGDFEIRKTPSLIKGLQGKIVTKVSCGGSYVIALGGNINISSKPLNRYGDDILRSVNEEQKRRSVLEKEVKYIDQSQYLQQDNQDLQDKVTALESQIEAEKNRKHNLLRDIDKMRNNPHMSNQGAIQREIDLLREENERLRNEKMTRKTKDTSKLSELLGEYEEKIEAEVKDKERILREKQQEINNLRDTIPKLKATINDLERDKMQFENNCKEEIRRLESVISGYNSQVNKEEKAKAELLSIHNDNIRRIAELDQRLTETIREKDRLGKEIEAYTSEIDQFHYQTTNKQGELKEELVKQENLQSSLSAKENDIKEIKSDYNRKAIEYKTEIDNIRKQITDITYDNERIQNKLNIKQIEIDTLNKDLIAWRQVVNNVTGENSALRNITAKLEDKQRRLTNNRPSVEHLDIHTANIEYRSKEKVLHTLETYEGEEDEGRAIEQTEQISDPYLQQKRPSLY